MCLNNIATKSFAFLLMSLFSVQFASAADEWDINIGAGAAYRPAYIGSSSYEFKVIPYATIIYDEQYFIDPRKGVGAYLKKETRRNKFNLSASLKYNFFNQRDESDNINFVGLGDIEKTIEVAASAYYKVGSIKIEIDAAQAIGSKGHDGLHGELKATYSYPINRSLVASVGPFAKFGNKNYNQYNFGVTPAQASRTMFNPYSVGSGFSEAGVSTSLFYRISDKWRFLISGSYAKILGEYGSSPLIEEKNQFSAFTAVFYNF